MQRIRRRLFVEMQKQVEFIQKYMLAGSSIVLTDAQKDASQNAQCAGKF